MYLVVHEDRARGEAIVAALGGERAARLVSCSIDAMRCAEAEGRPQAVLACPDAIDALLVSGELPAEPNWKGVPVLYDGGRTGPVYRAFVEQWRSGLPFHHLHSATPAQAAEALRALEAHGPGRAATAGVEPNERWRKALALASLALLVAWLWAGWPPARFAMVASGSSWLAFLLGHHGLPVVAAVRRGLWPSVSALVMLAVLVGTSGVALPAGLKVLQMK